MRSSSLLILALALLVPSVGAHASVSGRLLTVFRAEDGYAIYSFNLASMKGWQRISPPQDQLSDALVQDEQNFLGLEGSNLVLFPKDGSPTTVLANVNAFDYNRGKKMVVAITHSGTTYSLGTVVWPELSCRLVNNHPPVDFTSGVSSQTDKVAVESVDGKVYLAGLDDFVFKPVASGEDPLLSPTGRSLAFLNAGNRSVRILDTRTRRLKAYPAKRVGRMAWVGEDALAYSYAYKTVFMIKPVMRMAILNLTTGRITPLPNDDRSPEGITWSPE